MDDIPPKSASNPLVTVRHHDKLMKQWRSLGLWALPFAIAAFVIAILFEGPQFGWWSFDVIAYAILTILVGTTYLVFLLRPKYLRQFTMASAGAVSGYYVIKLIRSLFFEQTNILENITGNFVWTPIVLVVIFFAPRIGRLRWYVLYFTLAIAGISAFYWVPKLIAGQNLGTVQVLIQITLSMAFATAIVTALALTRGHYSWVESAAETYEKLALRDDLTELPNRNAFANELEATVEQAKAKGSNFVLALLTIDRFSNLKNSYDTSVSEAILQQVAKRLRAHLTDDDFVARLQGDEFVILSHSAAREEDIRRLGGRILDAFDNPFYFQTFDLELALSAAIGLARYPVDETASNRLLAFARRNMDRIRLKGQNGYAIGSTVHFARDSLANELLISLHRGFSWEYFELRYRPWYDLHNNLVAGAEATLLWRSSAGKIDIQELRGSLDQSGNIVKIERGILEHVAFAACRAQVPAVSVNISPLHFAQSDFLPYIRKLLSETGLSPERLTLELDFATLNSNPTLVEQTMRDLSNLGVHFVLDNFGLDYVSSHTLANIPLAGIKLSPKLLTHDMLSRDHSNFTQTLIALLIEQAQDAGIAVIGTGVEDEAHIAALRNLGCEYGQGSWWGEPQLSLPGQRSTLTS